MDAKKMIIVLLKEKAMMEVLVLGFVQMNVKQMKLLVLAKMILSVDAKFLQFVYQSKKIIKQRNVHIKNAP